MAKILSFVNYQNKRKFPGNVWETFVSLDTFSKIFLFTALLILISTPFVITNRQIFNPKAAGGNTLIVGSGGYPNISSAVSVSQNGDTISVHAGRYPEIVTVNKEITIQAFGDGQVWIDGECSKENNMAIQASNVIIKGIGMKKARGSGVGMIGMNNVTIDGVTIQDYNCGNLGDDQYLAGVMADGGTSGLKVINSTIKRRVEVSGTPNGYGNGIWVKNINTSRGGGHYFANNIIVGGYDGIGGEPEDQAFGGVYRDTIIENNLVQNCNDDGIQVEGGNINVKVRNNTIEGCPIGIALAPTITGPLYIENNIIKNGVRGDQGQFACYKMGDGGSGIAYLTGNNCNLPKPAGYSEGADGYKQTNTGMNPIVSRRNIIQVSRYVFEIEGNSGHSFDEDCINTADPNRFVKWDGSAYYSMASFRSSTGQELNGKQTTDCNYLGQGGGGLPQNTIAPLNSPTLAFTPTSVPQVNIDSDSDKFTDSIENYTGTSSSIACGPSSDSSKQTRPSTSWPADVSAGSLLAINYINGQDVLAFNQRLNKTSGQSGYDKRWDLNGDSQINSQDVNIVSSFFGKSCGQASGLDVVSPSVSITRPQNGATVSGKSVRITISVSDNKGVAGWQISIGGKIVTTSTSASGGNYYWNSTTVSNGNYQLTATAADIYGNRLSKSISIKVAN